MTDDVSQGALEAMAKQYPGTAAKKALNDVVGRVTGALINSFHQSEFG